MKKILLLLVLCLGLVGCSNVDYGIFTKETYNTLSEHEKEEIERLYLTLKDTIEEINNGNYKEASNIIWLDVKTETWREGWQLEFLEIVNALMETFVSTFTEEVEVYNYEEKLDTLRPYLNKTAINNIKVKDNNLQEYREYRWSTNVF
jgi:hypothetical protein